MELRILIRRLILGVPLLIPAYTLNLVVVFLLNIWFHLSPTGILSTVIIGDVVAYIGNTALAPYILIYLKRTKFFTKEELER